MCYFLESTGSWDVINDFPRCLTCKYTNTNTQMHKCTNAQIQCKHWVLGCYKWFSQMSDMQIHKYKYTNAQIHKCTNTVYAQIKLNDETLWNPLKCFIFGKPLMQGCWKWYLELSIIQIQKTSTQRQCIHKYPNLQLYIMWQYRLAQLAGRPHKLTGPRIWSSKRVCWDSRDIRDKNAVNGVSWGNKGQFLAWNIRSASHVSSYEAVFPED